MPFYTDPIDTILTGLFAKPRVLQPDPSPRATGRCPQCRYLVALPCQVCAQQPPVSRLDTVALLEQAQSSTLSAKAQAILALAIAWVKAHPQRELTSEVIDRDDHFPFNRQYVYNHFGKISLLNRQARDAAYPGTTHQAKMGAMPRWKDHDAKAVVLDESSMSKHFSGVRKQAMITTPAPNDCVE